MEIVIWKLSTRYIYWIFIGLAFLLVYCNQETQTVVATNTYLNLQDSVEYVGMETCRSCHSDIHKTFIHTGMGRSFDDATPQKSDATFDKHAIVYDAKSDFYYTPFFKNDILHIKEFRLKDGDTTHSRTERIDYIIGSGQHTNSHLINENGYIHQAPITYYTQKKQWDLAPGFERKNERFSRIISSECLTCHNHLPTPVAGSENKYTMIPKGIECERCHGPGEIHVQEKLRGNIVDTSKYIDYTIVNPRDLPVDLQMDLCQRCHLQGVAVLNEGKTFYDFKPGMKLSDVFNVFLPRYTNSHERFIMASQADRLRLSACMVKGEMSCITCHNPHQSIEATATSQYNNACINCHKAAKDKKCSVDSELRIAEDDNCVGCHMPRSGSIDIPHVNITDHYISKTNTKLQKVKTEETDAVAQFLGLELLTKKQATALDMAKGYLALYDKFATGDFQMLDSAYVYLQQSKAPIEQTFSSWIHYYFTKQDWGNLTNFATQLPIENIKDGWTTYRIGEAYYSLSGLQEALKYYQKAVEFKPYSLDFQEKLGTTYARLKQLKPAKEVFEFVLKENPKRKLSLTNLGFIYVTQRNFQKGEALYDKALALDPDYIQALLNKAALLLQKSQIPQAKVYLNRILKINPNHAQAKQILDRLVVSG